VGFRADSRPPQATPAQIRLQFIGAAGRCVQGEVSQFAAGPIVKLSADVYYSDRQCLCLLRFLHGAQTRIHRMGQKVIADRATIQIAWSM
jgi:hypothetical protein